ncbi:MAG: VF530 family DNA-binding protein [Hymenobacter sp.]
MPDARDANGHLIRELHGVTLATILEYLVAHYGFAGLDDAPAAQLLRR